MQLDKPRHVSVLINLWVVHSILVLMISQIHPMRHGPSWPARRHWQVDSVRHSNAMATTRPMDRPWLSRNPDVRTASLHKGGHKPCFSGLGHVRVDTQNAYMSEDTLVLVLGFSLAEILTCLAGIVRAMIQEALCNI